MAQLTCRFALLSLVFMLLGGCAKSNLQQTTLSLVYHQMEPVTKKAPGSARPVGSVEVVDGRSDQGVVGSRHAESDGSEASILASGDVRQWIRDAALTMLDGMGVESDSGSGPTLRLTLDEISVREDVFVNATYDGYVTVQAELLVRDRVAWSGVHQGFAENYGRAGSQENYAETLNHALDKALGSLLTSPGFLNELSR